MKWNQKLVWLFALAVPVLAARADLASLFTNVTRTAAVPRRPSILFIQCHGLGYGDLSCFGQTNFQTPNLDRLAAEGVRCTGYHAGNAGSTPAYGALLFGQAGAPAAGEFSLAQRLKLAGYHTGLIGEWPLNREPWRRGFDEFAGFFDDADAQNYYADHIWRYPHTLLDASNHVTGKILDHEMLYGNLAGRHEQYLPDLLLTATGNFLRIHQPDKFNRYRPFFLLVNLPAPRSASTNADDFPVPTDAPFSGESWPAAAKNRAALITRLDTDMGKLLEQVEHLGLTNNLVIFFASAAPPENFANTNLNFLRPHGALTAETLRAGAPLPLIVHWPKTVAAGKVNDRNFSPADLAATALDIALLKPAPEIAGQSLLPEWTGRPPAKP